MEKTRVIAVTVIHRTVENGVRGDKAKGIAPIKPVVKIIKPGTIFGVTASEFEELMATGAIRVPDKNEKVVVSLSHAAVVEEEDDAPAPKPKAAASRAKPKPAAKTITSEDLV